MWYMHDVGWGWWLLMSLGDGRLRGLFIYGAIWLVRGSTPSAKRISPEPPLTVLKRRLAAGEISVEEYERLHEAVGNDQREITML